MYDVNVARLERDTPRVYRDQVRILQQTYEISFGGRVKIGEGVCRHPVPGRLSLPCLGCQDVVYEPTM